MQPAKVIKMMKAPVPVRKSVRPPPRAQATAAAGLPAVAPASDDDDPLESFMSAVATKTVA